MRDLDLGLSADAVGCFGIGERREIRESLVRLGWRRCRFTIGISGRGLQSVKSHWASTFEVLQSWETAHDRHLFVTRWY